MGQAKNLTLFLLYRFYKPSERFLAALVALVNACVLKHRHKYLSDLLLKHRTDFIARPAL